MLCHYGELNQLQHFRFILTSYANVLHTPGKRTSIAPDLYCEFCEEKYRDILTRQKNVLTTTHLRCTSDQIKAAPCAAFLSCFNLNSVAHLHDHTICYSIAICTVAQQQAAEDYMLNSMRLLIKKPDSMFKMHAGWFHRVRWLRCCPRYTAFVQWNVL